MSQTNAVQQLNMSFPQIQKYAMGLKAISVGRIARIPQATRKSRASLLLGPESRLDRDPQEDKTAPLGRHSMQEAQPLAEPLEVSDLLDAAGSAEARVTRRSLSVMLQGQAGKGEQHGAAQQRCCWACFRANDSSPAYEMTGRRRSLVCAVQGHSRAQWQ